MKKNVLKIITATIIIVLCLICYNSLNNDTVIEIACYI